MPKKKKDTPGQKLWYDLYQADLYHHEVEKIDLAPGPGNAEFATRRWMEGMSRHLRERFSTGLRKRREELGQTQQQLANFAKLTVTAVAMIERGERTPSLDTAARLCWALDQSAGVTPEQLT
jgi:DNA-binding XRE family transcriptional regulator